MKKPLTRHWSSKVYISQSKFMFEGNNNIIKVNDKLIIDKKIHI